MSNFLVEFIELTARHLPEMKLIASLMASTCAMGFFVLCKSTENDREGQGVDWTFYFLGGFIAFAVSYFLQWVFQKSSKEVLDVISISGSAINNVFFFAAAATLYLKRLSHRGWVTIITLMAIPALFSIALNWYGKGAESFNRSLDSIPSVFCLMYFGRALSANIDYQKGNAHLEYFWKVAAYAVSILYSLTSICYVIVPISSFADQANSVLLVSGIRIEDISNGLDSIIVLLLIIPLRFSYFVIAIVVMARARIVGLLHSTFLMLERLAEAQSAEELLYIPQTIQERLQVDTVDFSIRIPVSHSPKMLIFKYPGQYPDNIDIIDLPDQKTIVGQVLTTVKTVWLSNLRKSTGSIFSKFIFTDDPDKYKQLGVSDWEIESESFVLVPIVFQKSVVGYIQATTKNPRKITAFARSYLRRLATLFSPSVQAFREHAATDQFGIEFAKWQVSQEKATIQSSERGIQDDINQLAAMIQNILSPLKTELLIDIGFTKFPSEQPDSHNEYNSLHKTQKLYSGLRVRGTEHHPELTIGNLILIIPQHDDGTSADNHLALGTHYLHRRAFAALTSEYILEIYQTHFNIAINGLSIKLNSSNTFEDWEAQIEQTVLRLGIQITFARNPETEEIIGGKNEPELRQFLESQPIYPAFSVEIEEVSNSPLSGQKVISLSLPKSKTSIWFGISRKDFGHEIIPPSPWRVFLERLGEIADISLAGIITQQKLHEAAKVEGLAVAAVTIDTLFHQIVNIVRNVSLSLPLLREALEDHTLTTTDEEIAELIRKLPEQTSHLEQLAKKLRGFTQYEGQKPCLLSEAAIHAQTLLDGNLTLRKIQLQIKIPNDLKIDFPLNVASMAISNLVMNASDAISTMSVRRDGIIHINIEKLGDWIHCHIIDNGPGIPEDLKDRIFDLGFSTKREGRGWGLYLVKRAMRENGGKVELTESRPGFTKFSLIFPKLKEGTNQ
ncbi:MAG: sensor histidine kinase [Acidobacteria bacterium]|nr:sensor histidine kinase [Acidobacteriota bacterium]